MKKLLLGLLCFVSVSLSYAVPLSGVLTIDSASAASSTNFQTWLDFRNALVNNGISGLVTVNVLTDKTETAQISFPSITGSSALNKIIINGNGHLLSAAVNDAVVLFSGADYMYIDSVTIRNTSTAATALGIRFYNASDYNTITRCTIQYSGRGGGSFNSGAYIAFAANSSNIMTSSSSSNGNNNQIIGNTMETISLYSRGPTYGIVLVGNSADYASTGQNNTIRGNRIHNFFYMGIYMFRTNGNHVSANEITRRNSDSANCHTIVYGIYSDESYCTDRASRIDSNVIHRLPFDTAASAGNLNTFYGIYTNHNIGNASNRFSENSNVIGLVKANTEIYLVYNSYASYLDLLNNIAYQVNFPVPSSNSNIQFRGFLNMYTAGSYRLNGNTIRNCNGGFYWYGIQNLYPLKATGVQEINSNTIIENVNSGYYKYEIYSYYADKSYTSSPIKIQNNRISKNQNDGNYHYGIYCNYYGNYYIEDNILDSNSSSNFNLTGLYLGAYCNYTVRRNLISHNLSNTQSSGVVYGMYLYYTSNTEISGNLMYGNSGFFQTYGIYLSTAVSGNYKINVVQNTIVLDGSLTTANATAYAVYLLCNYSKLNFNGNILDVQNFMNSYYYFSTYNTLNCHYNTFYTPLASGFQYWNTISSGTASSDTGFIRIVNGIQNFVADSGNYFDSRYASSLFKNQNNFPSYAVNLLDVYNVSRDSAFSDRGAVEYSGLTSLKPVSYIQSSKHYPNPVIDGNLFFLNKNNNTV